MYPVFTLPSRSYLIILHWTCCVKCYTTCSDKPVRTLWTTVLNSTSKWNSGFWVDARVCQHNALHNKDCTRTIYCLFVAIYKLKKFTSLYILGKEAQRSPWQMWKARFNEYFFHSIERNMDDPQIINLSQQLQIATFPGLAGQKYQSVIFSLFKTECNKVLQLTDYVPCHQ